MLVVLAGSVCLFGTWVGMRHFARARATEGTTRMAGCSWPPSAPVRHCGPPPSSRSWRSTRRSNRLRTGRDRRRAGRRHPGLPGRLRDRQPPFYAGAGNRRPRDGCRHPRHASSRSPPGAGTSPAPSAGTLTASPSPSCSASLERARGQPRQSPGDPVVPPWRGDRAGVHGLRHPLRHDGFDHRGSRSVGRRCRHNLIPAHMLGFRRWSPRYCW